MPKDIAMPNLPGYGQNRTKTSKKNQSFTFVNGYAMEIPPEMKMEKKKEEREIFKTQRSLEVEATNRKNAFKPGTSSRPLWLENDKKVLRFYAYFKEAVHESESESFRVRHCEIFYYLEDNTVHISEVKVENSGIPQGKFVKRHRIPKPDSKGFYEISDFDIGREITIYSRTFYICGVDGFTRSFLESKGRKVKDNESAPQDDYTKKREEHMMRETGADPSIYRGVLMNPMKKFVEARLGKAFNKNLDGFLKFDRQVLCFDAFWDDRARRHGALHKYKMHYYLTDDTVEFVEVHKRNSGFSPFPKLLSRNRLPKDPSAYKSSEIGENEINHVDYYSWKDIRIGMTLLVFGRKVTILDANKMTREFYEKEGRTLATGLPFPEEKTKPRPKLAPPPHNGIGSEEDSLGNCDALIPKAPYRDIYKLQALAGKYLRFEAKLVSSRADDAHRKFVITYYLADDTIQVFEPPKRNSGIVGGKFLRRARMKNSRQEYYKPNDIFVGATVTLGGFTFKVEGTDNYTIKYMEDHREDFPMANIDTILTKMRSVFSDKSRSMESAFREMDEDGSGAITVVEFKQLISRHFSPTEITEQEMLTVMRFFDSDNSGTISFNEFAKKIRSDGGELKMDTSINVEAYAEKVNDAVYQDFEKQNELKAAAYFDEIVAGQRSRMLQAFRIADFNVTDSIPTHKVVAIMSEVLSMAPVDGKRVCKHKFGDTEAISLTQFKSIL